MKLTWLIVLSAFVMLFLGGCGSNGDNVDSENQDKETSSEASAEPASEFQEVTDDEVKSSIQNENFESRDVPDAYIPESYDGMVKIEGGPYTYYFTNADASKNVNLFPYYIDEHEVTNDEFAAFVEATGHTSIAKKKGFGYIITGDRISTIDGAYWREPNGPGSSIEGKGDHPVMFMTYIDARSYCEWLGKRLPTKIEFEFAAAGGANAFTWSHGNEFDPDKYNYIENSDSQTKPATWGPKNIFGLYNMSGNLWEWAQDKRHDYFPIEYLNECPNTFALCGGSYNSSRSAIKTRIRIFHNPARAYNDQGFRCAAEVQQ